MSTGIVLPTHHDAGLQTLKFSELRLGSLMSSRRELTVVERWRPLVMFLKSFVRAGAIALLCSVAPLAANAQSLTDALAHAYSNNPSIASSFLDVRAAREGIRAAEGARLP